MKTLQTFTMVLALCLTAKVDAQFLKKLVKRAGEVAEETLKRKSEEKKASAPRQMLLIVFLTVTGFPKRNEGNSENSRASKWIP